MTATDMSLTFQDQNLLEGFASRLSTVLCAGDTLLLTGEIGAGKSVFSRAVILALLQRPEDIPSPTFTIIQTYEAPDFEIWHCDLYRLTEISQTDELGLEQGFETALCLIEWPEILGPFVPPNALRIDISVDLDNDQRTLKFVSNDHRWTQKIENAHHGS